MESCHHPPAPTVPPFRSSCRAPSTPQGASHPPATLTQLVRVIEQLKAKDRIISQLEKELGQQSGLAASLSSTSSAPSSTSSQLPCARTGQATPSLAPAATPDPPGGRHGTEAGSDSLPHSDPQTGDCGDNGRGQTERELRELQEHFARLVQEKEEIMRRSREVETKNRQLQERSRRLLEQNISITSDNRSLKDQSRTVALENRKLKDHVEQSKSRWLQLSRQLSEEQQARSRLESQTASVQSLKQNLAEQSKTISALRQTLAEKDRRIELIQHRKKRKRLLKLQGKQSPGVRETFYGYDEDEISIESETSQSSMSQGTVSDEELMEEITKEELEKRLEQLTKEHQQLQRSHSLLASKVEFSADPQREFKARQQLEDGLLAAQCHVEDLQRRLQAKEQDEAFQWLLEKENLLAERQALLEKVRLLEAGEAELQQELREARDRSDDLEFRLLELEEHEVAKAGEDEVRSTPESGPGLEAARMEALQLRKELAELLEARGVQAQSALDRLASLRHTEQRLHDLEVTATELQAKVISLQQEKTTLEDRLRHSNKQPASSGLSQTEREKLANYELKIQVLSASEEALTSRLEQEQTRADLLEKSLAQLQQDLSGLQAQNEGLEADLAKLQLLHQDSEARAKKAEAELHQRRLETSKEKETLLSSKSDVCESAQDSSRTESQPIKKSPTSKRDTAGDKGTKDQGSKAKRDPAGRMSKPGAGSPPSGRRTRNVSTSPLPEQCLSPVDNRTDQMKALERQLQAVTQENVALCEMLAGNHVDPTASDRLAEMEEYCEEVLERVRVAENSERQMRDKLRLAEQTINELEAAENSLQDRVDSLKAREAESRRQSQDFHRSVSELRELLLDREAAETALREKVEFMEKVEMQSTRRIQELEESEQSLRQQLQESRSPEREQGLEEEEQARLEELQTERDELSARVEELEENEEILRENWRRVADEDANRIQCLEQKVKMEECVIRDLKRRLAEAEETAAMGGARSVGAGASLAAELSQFQSASMPDVSGGHGFGLAPYPQAPSPTPSADVMESILERESALRERIDELESAVEERNSKIEILQEKMASLRESEMRLGETVVEMEQSEKQLRAKLALYESSAVTVETVLKYEDKIKELRCSQESLLDQLETMEEDLQNQYSERECKLQNRIRNLERRLADMERRDDDFITTRAALENQVMQLQERDRQAVARTATLDLQLKARQDAEAAATAKWRVLEKKVTQLTEQTSQLSEQRSQLEQEALVCREAESNALAQCEVLEKQDAELCEKLLQVEGEKRELEEEKMEWEREKSELVEKVESLSSKESALLAQVEKLSSKEKELTGELERMSSQHKLLSEQVKVLSSREKELQTKTEQLSSREKELLDEVDAMSSKGCEGCRDMEKVKTDHHKLLSQHKALQQKLEEARREKESLEHLRAEGDETGRQRAEELEERLATAEGENASLAQRVSQMQEERETLEQSISRLEETESDHFAMISSLENQVDALEMERDSLGAQSARASAQVEALSAEAGRLSTEVERLSRDRESHLNEINTLESRHVRMSEQLSRHVTQAQADQAALKEKEERIQQLQAQLSDRETSVADVESRIEDLLSQVSELENNLQEKESRLEDLQSNRSYSEGKVFEKDQEIENLRAQLSEKEIELQKLLSNISSHENQALEKDNKVSELLSQLTHQRKAVEERDVKVVELQSQMSEVENLKEKVQELEKMKEQVKELQKEKQELESKHQANFAELAELRDQVTKLTATQRESSDLASLHTENQELQVKVADLSKVKAALEVKLDASQSEVVRVERSLEVFRDAESKMMERLTQLEEREQSLTQELEKARASMAPRATRHTATCTEPQQEEDGDPQATEALTRQLSTPLASQARPPQQPATVALATHSLLTFPPKHRDVATETTADLENHNNGAAPIKAGGLFRRVQELEEENKALTTRLGPLEGADVQCRALREKVRVLEAGEERLMDRVVELEQREEQLTKQLERARQTGSSSEAGQSSGDNKDRKSEADLKRRLAEVEQERSELEDQGLRLEAACREAEEKACQQQQACQELSDRCQQLESALQESRARVAELISAKEKAAAALQQLSLARDETEQRCLQLETDLTEKEEQIKELDAQVDRLVGSKNETVVALERLKSAHQELLSRAKDFTRTEESVSADLDAERKKTQALRDELSKTQHALERMKKESESRINHLTLEGKQLKEEVNRLKRRTAELEATEKKLLSAVDSHKQRERALEKELSAAKTQLKSSQADKESSTEATERSTRHVSQMLAQFGGGSRAASQHSQTAAAKPTHAVQGSKTDEVDSPQPRSLLSEVCSELDCEQGELLPKLRQLVTSRRALQRKLEYLESTKGGSGVATLTPQGAVSPRTSPGPSPRVVPGRHNARSPSTMERPEDLLQKRIEDLEKLEQYLRQQVADLETDREQLHEIARKDKSVVHDLNVRIRELQLSESTLRAQVTQYEKSERELYQKSETLEEEKAGLEDRVRELEILERRLRDLVRQLRLDEERWMARNDNMEATVEELTNTEASLKAQLDLLEKEREALTARSEELGARLASMQGTESALTSHVMQYENQHVSLQSRLAHLETSEAMAHSRASELDAVNQDMNQRLSAAAQENAALLQHVSHLQSQVEQLDRELLKWRDQSVGLGQEVDSMRKSEASLHKRQKEMELKAIDSQGQLRELEQTAAILKDRNTALQRSENKLRHRLQELEASHPLLSGDMQVSVKEKLPMTLEDCHRRIMVLQRQLSSRPSTDSDSSHTATARQQTKEKNEAEVKELREKIDSYRIMVKGLKASLSRDQAPALWDSDPEGLGLEGEDRLPARRLQGAERQRLMQSMASLTPAHAPNLDSNTDLDLSDSTLEEPLSQQVVARTSAAPRPHRSEAERAAGGAPGPERTPRDWVAVGRATSHGSPRGHGHEELGLSLALASETESQSAVSRPHSDVETKGLRATLAAPGAAALPRGVGPGGPGGSSTDSEPAPPLPSSLPPMLPARGGRAGSHFGHAEVTSSASARRPEGAASFAPQTAPPSAHAAPAPVAMETGPDGNSAIASVRGQSIRERIAQIEKQLQTKGSDSKSEDEESAHAWKTKALVRSRKLETVEKENKHLKDEIQKLETELEEKRRYIKTVQKWLSELDETLKNKEHKPDRHIVQQLQTALCNIRTDLQNCASHHDDDPDIATLRTQLSQQQRQLSAKDREVDMLLKELGQSQREARELEEMRGKALDSLRALELELVALQDADVQLRSLQHSYSALRSQFEEMEGERNNALTSVTPLKAKVGRLMRRCKDKDDLIRRLGSEVRRVRGGGKPSPLLEELAKLETAAAGDPEMSTLLNAGAWQSARRGSALERDQLLSSPSSASDEAEPYSDTELLALSQSWAPRRPKSADQERRARRHLLGSRSRGVRGPTVTPGGLYVTVADYTPGLLSHSGHPDQELAVKEGDVVTVTGPVDSSGYCPVDVKGQSGLVPADYLHPLHQSTALRQTVRTSVQTPQGEMDGIPEKLARLYQHLHQHTPLPPPSDTRVPPSQVTSHSTQTQGPQGLPPSPSKARKGAAPDPPSNFQVVRAVGDYGVLVSWTPPDLDALGRSNGSQVTGYKIYLDGQVYQQAHSPYLAKAILEHLPSGRSHRLAVQTVAASGLTSPLVELVWQGSTASLQSPHAHSPHPDDDLASSLAPHHFDQKQKRVFMALYDYEPQEHAPPGYGKVALALRAGDIILVYGDMRKDGFYYGEVEGRRGLVAQYFAEEVPATLKSKPTSSTPANQRSPRPPGNSGHSDLPAPRPGHRQV